MKPKVRTDCWTLEEMAVMLALENGPNQELESHLTRCFFCNEAFNALKEAQREFEELPEEERERMCHEMAAEYRKVSNSHRESSLDSSEKLWSPVRPAETPASAIFRRKQLTHRVNYRDLQPLKQAACLEPTAQEVETSWEWPDLVRHELPTKIYLIVTTIGIHSVQIDMSLDLPKESDFNIDIQLERGPVQHEVEVFTLSSARPFARVMLDEFDEPNKERWIFTLKSLRINGQELQH